jgi:hypothetical protein
MTKKSDTRSCSSLWYYISLLSEKDEPDPIISSKHFVFVPGQFTNGSTRAKPAICVQKASGGRFVIVPGQCSMLWYSRIPDLHIRASLVCVTMPMAKPSQSIR